MAEPATSVGAVALYYGSVSHSTGIQMRSKTIYLSNYGLGFGVF